MDQRFSRRTFLNLVVAAGGYTLLPEAATLAAQTGEAPFFVDGHMDLGWNIVNYGRDYTRSAYDLRREPSVSYAGQAMIGLPELLAGRVALLVGTIYVIPAQHVTSVAQRAYYSTPEEASTWGWVMLSAIEALAESSAQITMVRTQTDLDAVLASWAPGQPAEAHTVGIILGMEGADPITSPDDLPLWYTRGLRSIGLSWGRTRYAGSNSDAGDLTDAGRDLLAAMRDLNMVFDVAHLSEAAFWSALTVWEGPIMCSHGNSRVYLPTERGLSASQLQALAARGGVLGIGLYDGFWQRRRRQPATVTLLDVADAIDTVCQLTGSCAHVAIGSDVDGGFGAEMSPVDTVADIPQIAVVLSARGYSAEDVDAIAHGNWLRIWRAALP